MGAPSREGAGGAKERRGDACKEVAKRDIVRPKDGEKVDGDWLKIE